jgi:hypothetical protein
MGRATGVNMNEQDVLAQLVIDQTKLEEHMTDQPARFARFAFLAAKADDSAERVKMAKKVKEAELDAIIRAQMAQAGDKITEAAIAARVAVHPDYILISAEVMLKKLESDLLNAAVEAFRSRANMLSSLGAMRRAEMEQSTYLGTPVQSRGQAHLDAVNSKLKQQFFDGKNKKSPRS